MKIDLGYVWLMQELLMRYVDMIERSTVKFLAKKLFKRFFDEGKNLNEEVRKSMKNVEMHDGVVDTLYEWVEIWRNDPETVYEYLKKYKNGTN